MKLELVNTCIKAVMLIIAVFIAPAIKEYFKQHTEDKRIANINRWALVATSAAEKFKELDPTGANRKAFAADFLIEIRDRMKLDFTDEEIESVIEATVSDYNELWNMRHDSAKKREERNEAENH